MRRRRSQLLIPWIELLFLMNIHVKIFTLAQQQQQSMNGNMATSSPNQQLPQVRVVLYYIYSMILFSQSIRHNSRHLKI